MKFKIFKRINAIWLGESDEDGFMTNGKTYRIYKITTTNHCEFQNNKKQRDMAHIKYFKFI